METAENKFLSNSFNNDECLIVKKMIMEVIEQETRCKFDKVRKLEKKDN